MANVQVTISGKDYNGFVWQMVFYLVVGEGDHPINVVLQHACDHAETILFASLVEAMSNQTSIFDIAAKYVKPDSSYTVHKAENTQGTRDLNSDTGATAGWLQWLTQEGPETGRQYIPGVCGGDYVNDFISDGYKALLTNLRDSFKDLTGNDGLFDWIFVVYSKGDEPTVDPVVDGVVKLRCGVLSKRVRP